MIVAYLIIALVAAQRLAEVVIAQRNTRALLANGATEIAPGHYPLFILLHATWLIAIVAMLPRPVPIYWTALAGYIALQALRVWTVASLGRYWTTRIITMPGAPLIRTGPYRLVRHPNYLIVIGEIALLPLVFGELRVAIAFSVLNALLLAWRIRAEDAALATRRAL
ncbi:MAG TPA: isoprenylcysteine carboxylmethyltransferase family protein [Rhizomicrobium sp.]|jgi:methyltransferase